MQLGPRFSYIHSNIAPSHSSCPTSFSVCNFPPEYWYIFLPHLLYRLLIFQVLHVKPVMHKHLLGPKEQGLDEIHHFLHPIVSDLLQLWKDGIMVPTESRPEGVWLVTALYMTC